MALNWLEEIESVSSVGLTVQAQALSLDEVDPNRALKHPVLFPYTDADSTDLRTIFETDFRPVADRRAWDAPGRQVPLVLPEIEVVSMLPVESYFQMGEEELGKARAMAGGNEAVYRDLVRTSIPRRVDGLVGANFRRVEVDALEAAAKGTITLKNPTSGATAQTFSLGFAAGRVQTAGTAWNDGGVNAFSLFQSWLADGESEMGPIPAVMGRRLTLNAILADAPNIADYGGVGVKLTQNGLNDRLADILGHPFRFIVVEDQADVFTDGGTAYTRTSTFPAGYLVALPASGQLGATYRAPVLRAQELSAAAPGAGIDVRGMTVYYIPVNDGKGVKVQCQANHLPLPFERNVWSINTLVS